MSSKGGQLNEKPNKYNRRFSEAYKRERVEAIEARQITAQTTRIHGISTTSRYNWVYRYSDKNKGTRRVFEMESEGEKMEGLLRRIAELERVVGQKQMALDVADQTIALASEEVGFDLKKSTLRCYRTLSTAPQRTLLQNEANLLGMRNQQARSLRWLAT
jgi:transposase-like protein